MKTYLSEDRPSSDVYIIKPRGSQLSARTHGLSGPLSQLAWGENACSCTVASGELEQTLGLLTDLIPNWHPPKRRRALKGAKALKDDRMLMDPLVNLRRMNIYKKST